MRGVSVDTVDDIRRFREAVAKRELLIYDELDTSPKHIALNFANELDDMLAKGWMRHGQHVPSLKPPLPWNDEGYGRSFRFHMHAWEPTTFLLMGSCLVDDKEKRRKYFKASFDIAKSWIELFQLPVLDKGPDYAISEENTKEQGFAWYDMAVGQRIYRLAFILDVISRDEEYSDEIVELFYRSLIFHHDVLSIDDFFKVETNHGLYQALGQLAAANRFMDVSEKFGKYYGLANERLNSLLNRHFSESDVHLEHSPGYHYMIMGTLVGATQNGLIRDKHVLDRIRRLEEAFSWMIQPDHGLLTFGDSDPRSMYRGERLASRFSHPALRYIISGGTMGERPESGVKFYPDAGYAFARVYAPDVEPEFRNASYLAQHAGFHSRTHKHADHFTFVWHDRQRDILVDPGRYAYAGRTNPRSKLAKEGFWYSDPKRIYVESTRAHNCVEIDNTSYPRGRHMAKPFGSALKYAGEQDGIVVTECETKHFGHVRHWRGLVMVPGHFLLVLDWLYDRRQQIGRHDYRQWFKFHPDWQVEKDGDVIRAFAPEDENRPALSLSAGSLLPGPHLSEIFRGQKKPQLQGWYSDKAYSLVPAASLNFALENTALAQFATLFTFGDVLEIDHAACRVNTTMRAGRFVWTDERGRHELRFDRDHDQHMTVTMESVGKS